MKERNKLLLFFGGIITLYICIVTGITWLLMHPPYNESLHHASAAALFIAYFISMFSAMLYVVTDDLSKKKAMGIDQGMILILLNIAVVVMAFIIVLFSKSEELEDYYS